MSDFNPSFSKQSMVALSSVRSDGFIIMEFA